MTEFPEQRVKTDVLVEDVLKSTFFKLTGHEPKEGNFFPNSTLADQLDLIFEDREELIEFLKLSIALHIWMGEQENTENVPFYVNKVLLSEKRLSLLDKYSEFLRSRYGSKIENVKSFTQDVYSDVVNTEGDYWNLAAASFMHGDPVHLEYVRPTIFWVLSCCLLKRFKGLEKRSGCPVIFADRVVTYDGRKMGFDGAWNLELSACKSSQKRGDLLMERACAALSDIRLDWATKVGLILPYRDDFGKNKYKNVSGINMDLLDIQDGDNMYDKDRELLVFAKEWLTKEKGVTFEKSHTPRMVVGENPEDVVEAKPEADGFKVLSDKRLNPVLDDLLK